MQNENCTKDQQKFKYNLLKKENNLYVRPGIFDVVPFSELYDMGRGGCEEGRPDGAGYWLGHHPEGGEDPGGL